MGAVTACPTFTSGLRSLRGGSTPPGYGLLGVFVGMTPSTEASIVVVRTASTAPPLVPATIRGRKKIPYPPRMTVLLSALYAKPNRGPKFRQSVDCWF